MNYILNEDTRRELISKGQRGKNYVWWNQTKGKNRFYRRTKSRIANSTREFNKIDMNKLFNENILDVTILVHGETNNYSVRISFGGFLDELQEQVQRNNDLFDIRTILISLTNCFNKDNVYVRCSCPDFYYRFSYWLSIDDIIVGEKQDIPSPITNPNNDLGSGCKHILLVLNNKSWLIKVASVIMNYCKYMEQHYQRKYADIIFPKIYGRPYDADVQLGFEDDNTDELSSTETELDVANELGRTRGQFKKGNTQGLRFAPNENDENQISLDDLSDDELESQL